MTTPDPIRAALERLIQAEVELVMPYDECGPAWRELIAAARAALAAAPPDGPAVPEGREPAAVIGEPSDQELKAAYWEAYRETAMCGAEASWLAGLRAVAGLGRPTATLLQQLSAAAPAVVPVAVSERLPGAEDCDAEGRCWLLTVEDEYPQWRLHSVEGHQPGGRMIWVPVDRTPGVMVDAFYASHWLPAHAIPLPAPQAAQEEA